MGTRILTQGLRQSLRWTWWASRPSYFRVFLRELSSFFFAIQLILMLVMFHKAGQSAEDYRFYLDFLWNPGMVLFHSVSVLFALWHTYTFFNLLPQAISIRVMGRRIPGVFLVAPQFGAWAVVSGLIITWVWWVGAA